MRRKDREVTDLGAIERIIGDCKVLRLGMVDGRRPYVVPLNFGFDLRGGVLELYCHSAPEGRKVEVLRRNPEVCFEMDFKFLGAVTVYSHLQSCGVVNDHIEGCPRRRQLISIADVVHRPPEGEEGVGRAERRAKDKPGIQQE